ncbi:MAG: hypothetical protein RL660_2815 [Bacteroidota bacterium]|jgi:hypothetical protein
MLAHEIPHSFFHVDSQIVANFRMMLTKPGEMLNDFIGGKRKRYFPPVMFTIIAVTVFLFSVNYSPDFDIESMLTVDSTSSKVRQILINAVKFIQKYFKFYILIIPLLISWVTYLVYKKSKYNFPEHAVINAFIFSIILYLLSITSILFRLAKISSADTDAEFYVSTAIIIAYNSFCFYKTYRYFYSKPQMYFRIALTILLSLASVFLLFFGTLIMALAVAGQF